MSTFLGGHGRREPSDAITVGQVSTFYLQRQMTLTYFHEIWGNPSGAGPTMFRFEGVLGPMKHTRDNFVFCPQNKYNACDGIVDSNLDPDYILLSLKFCFINCSTGGCLAECCLLSHRQPDNKYWRKGNFKISLMNRCPLRTWAKINPRGFLRKPLLTYDLPQGTFHKLTLLSEMTTHLWCFTDILEYVHKLHDENTNKIYKATKLFKDLNFASKSKTYR